MFAQEAKGRSPGKVCDPSRPSQPTKAESSRTLQSITPASPESSVCTVRRLILDTALALAAVFTACAGIVIGGIIYERHPLLTVLALLGVAIVVAGWNLTRAEARR